MGPLARDARNGQATLRVCFCPRYFQTPLLFSLDFPFVATGKHGSDHRKNGCVPQLFFYLLCRPFVFLVFPPARNRPTSCATVRVGRWSCVYTTALISFLLLSFSFLPTRRIAPKPGGLSPTDLRIWSLVCFLLPVAYFCSLSFPE